MWSDQVIALVIHQPGAGQLLRASLTRSAAVLQCCCGGDQPFCCPAALPLQVQALSPKAAEWTGTAAAVGAAAGAAAGAAVAGVGGSKQHQSSFMKGFKQSITVRQL
jgi:hypothetical protein